MEAPDIAIPQVHDHLARDLPAAVGRAQGGVSRLDEKRVPILALRVDRLSGRERPQRINPRKMAISSSRTLHVESTRINPS